MKPFNKLTYRGRIRRYRELARTALLAYGITGADIKFIQDSGNVTFRVAPSGSVSSLTESDRFFRDHCVLRLHQPDYQTTEAIYSELKWLEALSHDTHLAVPTPVPSLDGELFVEIEIPGVPYLFRCSLLRWMRGSLLSKNLRSLHFQALGRLTAGLHTHAEQWQLPAGFTRPLYDWNGLYGDNDFVKVPSDKVWSQIPKTHYKAFESVTSKVREVMDDFGLGRDAFGLIHADIGIGANVLFAGGEARVIDFDDCAFGFWMFDLGVAMSGVRNDREYPRFREALLEGYREVRDLPAKQAEHLELFIAAWHAFEVYWATAGGILFLDHKSAYDRWADRAAGDVADYFNEF